jgi:hypothetical protein
MEAHAQLLQLITKNRSICPFWPIRFFKCLDKVREFSNSFLLGKDAFRFVRCQNQKGGEACQKEVKYFGTG